MRRTIEETILALEVIRSALCAYRSPHGQLCDCKFGVHHLKDKNGQPCLPTGETGCGCPELYQAIGYLKELRELRNLKVELKDFLKDFLKGHISPNHD